MADGTTKNAIRRSPASSRRRTTCAPSASALAAPDIAGNSAADTAIPNKLTGSSVSVVAFDSALTAPLGNQVASSVSM